MRATYAPEGYRFSLTLRGPSEQHEIEVTPQAVLDYATCQREILSSLGVIYSHAVVEGREPNYANEIWRRFLTTINGVQAPAPAKTAEPAPAGLPTGLLN